MGQQQNQQNPAAAAAAPDLKAKQFVMATDVGYDNIAVRNPGDIFQVPKYNADGSIHTAPWFKPHKMSAEDVAAAAGGDDDLT